MWYVRRVVCQMSDMLTQSPAEVPVCQTSNMVGQTSDVVCQMSNMLTQTSAKVCQMSNMVGQMSDVVFQTSDIDCEQSFFSQLSLCSAGLERAKWRRGKLERGGKKRDCILFCNRCIQISPQPQHRRIGLVDKQ